MQRSTQGGAKKKGPDYKQSEVLAFLDIMELVQPIGPNDWEAVAQRHFENYPEEKRSVDSLRRKFNSLRNRKIPTGDPSCPPEVRKAKKIAIWIEQRSDAGAEANENDLGVVDEVPAAAGVASGGSTPSSVSAVAGIRPMSVPRPPKADAISSLTEVMMAQMVQRQEEMRIREEEMKEEREERRQNSRMMNMMMMTMMKSMQPETKKKRKRGEESDSE